MIHPDIIAIAAIVAIIGGAIFYIVKAKKSGKKCIGCPDSASCGRSAQSGCGSCSGCSACHHGSDTEQI